MSESQIVLKNNVEAKMKTPIDALDRRTREFFANCRFVRQFLKKKVPKNAIVKHAKATMEIGLFIGNDYLVDNNPVYDLEMMVYDGQARQSYLKNIVANARIYHDYLLPRNITILMFADGRAEINYPNGDVIVSRVAAINQVNPLSNINYLAELELNAKKAVEDAEKAVLDNHMPYDKRVGDIAINLVFLASCLGANVLSHESNGILHVIKSAGLNITPYQFEHAFTNRPLVLMKFILGQVVEISKMYEVVEEVIGEEVIEGDAEIGVFE